MKWRVIILSLIGIIIMGGATISNLVGFECTSCEADGKMECPECKGLGTFVLPLMVECGCRGGDWHCLICGGSGGYLSFTTGECPICEGEGGKTCPYCYGKGRIRANQRIIQFLKAVFKSTLSP